MKNTNNLTLIIEQLRKDIISCCQTRLSFFKDETRLQLFISTHNYISEDERFNSVVYNFL